MQIERIEMFGENEKIPEYFELMRDDKKGFHIRFPQSIWDKTEKTNSDMLTSISKMRDDMFKSINCSASVFERAIYLRMDLFYVPKIVSPDHTDDSSFMSPPVARNQTMKRTMKMVTMTMRMVMNRAMLCNFLIL